MKSKLKLPQKINYKKASIISTALICFVLVGITALLVLNKQYIIDQVNVWQFKPTDRVIALANRSGMGDYGKFLYYASRPEIEATQNFNQYCERAELETSTLSCYSNYRIYIYDINDPRLDGVLEVMAVHETLHAAYVRLSDSEKTRVDAMLELEFAKPAVASELKDLMEFYARAEPGQRGNELHSLIGTEILDINPELEKYYDQYFRERKVVVGLNSQYSGVFENMTKKTNQLAEQMNTLSKSISDKTTKYNSDVNTLNADIAAFNHKAETATFSSQAQFLAERNALMNRLSALEAVRAEINSSVAQYEAILKEYNSIDLETKKLYSSMDSMLAPAPGL